MRTLYLLHNQHQLQPPDGDVASKETLEFAAALVSQVMTMNQMPGFAGNTSGKNSPKSGGL